MEKNEQHFRETREHALQVAELWHRHHEEIRSYIRRRVACPDDAEDLLQEVYLRAQEKMGPIDGPSRSAAWLFKTTKHLVIDYYRRKNRHKKEVSLLEEPADVTEEFVGTYDDEVASCLTSMIQAMPEKFQQAIHLTIRKGMSQKQLAVETGLSYSGAKSQVQRGKKTLGEMLADCCDIEWDAYGHVVDMHHRKKDCSFC